MTVPARSVTKFEIRGKMEERTGWRGQNESQIVGEEKRNDRLVGAAETSKERAEWSRPQRKNLNKLGLPKRKKWPRCTERAVSKNAGAALTKRKRNRAVCPKHQIMRRKESRWARVAPLRERAGSEREHGVERVDSTVNEGRFQGGKGGQARRASLEQVEGSMSG